METALQNMANVLIGLENGAWQLVPKRMIMFIVYSIPGMNIEVRDCYKSETFPTIPGGNEVNRKIRNIYDKANEIYKKSKEGDS